MKLKQLTPDITERVEATLLKHPDWSDWRVAKSHCKWKVVTEHAAAIRKRMGIPEGPAPERYRKPAGFALEPVAERPGRKRGRTMDDFRKSYDYALILRNAVARHLSPASKVYYTDAEFRDLVGIPQQCWRRFADDEALAGHRLKRGEHNIWASIAMVREMKKILGIL